MAQPVPEIKQDASFLETVEFAEKIADAMFKWVEKHSPTYKGRLLQAFKYWYPDWVEMIETIYEEMKVEFNIEFGPSRGRFERVERISIGE